jgi:UDP-glucose:(heptosyl)LPS alpha-1,3-glucosyltransferase
MKLAFCLFRYFPFGGLQRDMIQIAQEAHSRGHTIDIFCNDWQGEQPTNMSVTQFKIKAFSNAAETKRYHLQLQSELAKKHFDAIVGFNKMPGLDLYFAADSCFAYKAYEERGWLYRQTSRSKVYLEFERAVFGKKSKTEILELSANERHRFIHFYGTDSNRFHSLPPGISRNRIMANNTDIIRAQSRSALGFTDDQPILLAIGSGFKTKGLDRSLNAVAALTRDGCPKIQLLVAGQDQPRTFIKQAKKLGIENQVHFLGGRDDVPDLLQAADLLIHPAYKENSGIALLEAIIAGLPVVTTDVCGYAHFIEETNMGQVIKTPFDPQALAAAIKATLAVERKTWQTRGYNFATHNDLYSLHSKAVDIIEQVANRNTAI